MPQSVSLVTYTKGPQVAVEAFIDATKEWSRSPDAVIVVTGDMTAGFRTLPQNCQLLAMPCDLPGHALLALGLGSVRTDLALVCDVSLRLDPDWLENGLKRFADSRLALATGPVGTEGAEGPVNRHLILFGPGGTLDGAMPPELFAQDLFMARLEALNHPLTPPDAPRPAWWINSMFRHQQREGHGIATLHGVQARRTAPLDRIARVHRLWAATLPHMERTLARRGNPLLSFFQTQMRRLQVILFKNDHRMLEIELLLLCLAILDTLALCRERGIDYAEDILAPLWSDALDVLGKHPSLIRRLIRDLHALGISVDLKRETSSRGNFGLVSFLEMLEREGHLSQMNRNAERDFPPTNHDMPDMASNGNPPTGIDSRTGH